MGTEMLTAGDVKSWEPDLDVSPDLADTAKLIAEFARLRCERMPFFLTQDEFERILRWKLGRQYGRQKAIRQANTEDLIRKVTGLAVNLCHEDEDYLAELRVNILCSLRGVGVPVASAVLALLFPDEYAVIDYRGWRRVFGKEQSGFFTPDYLRYLRVIRRLAKELGWTTQKVDHVIWEHDRAAR